MTMRVIDPTTGMIANFGCRRIHCMTKYGPSYFCVAPVALSPTTMDGR